MLFSFSQCVDRLAFPVLVSIVGNVSMATAFFFIGPVPLVPDMEPSVVSVISMVSLIGVSYALISVSTFGRCQKAAIELGYRDDVTTYLMIS